MSADGMATISPADSPQLQQPQRVRRLGGVPWITRLLKRLGAALDELSTPRMWWLVFVTAASVYTVTGHYHVVSVDVGYSYQPAWELIHHGHLWLSPYHGMTTDLLRYHGHWVSSRTPGVVLAALPGELLDYGAHLGSFIPMVVTSVVIAAATVATFTVVFTAFASQRTAVGAGAVLAFATGVWTVSSGQLWPHTVDGLAIALAFFAAIRGRSWLLGACGATLVLTRGPAAIVVVALAAELVLRRRSLWPLIQSGFVSFLGLAALIAWNGAVVGSGSVAGAYQGQQHTLLHAGGGYMLASLSGLLFSPSQGLFDYTLFAVPLVILAVFAARSAPRWAVAGAIGGALYALAKARLNGYNGGGGFYGNRYLIESMLMWIPLAFYAYHRYIAGHVLGVRTTRLLVAVAVLIQALGAFYLPEGVYKMTGPNPRAGWSVHPILSAVTHFYQQNQSTALGALALAAFFIAMPVDARSGLTDFAVRSNTKTSMAHEWHNPGP